MKMKFKSKNKKDNKIKNMYSAMSKIIKSLSDVQHKTKKSNSIDYSINPLMEYLIDSF